MAAPAPPGPERRQAMLTGAPMTTARKSGGPPWTGHPWGGHPFLLRADLLTEAVPWTHRAAVTHGGTEWGKAG